MILGTYWYFAFPTGIYEFEYFEFREGWGGIADKPAELIATIEAEHPEQLIADLEGLIERHADGFILIHREDRKMRLSAGGYQVFDYDFLLMLEAEKILNRHNVKSINGTRLENTVTIRLENSNSDGRIVYPEKKLLQVVGSELKKHNAENLKLRLDCHVRLAQKEGFIAALKNIATEEGLDIFFYFDKDFEDSSNLMLFFTNGRQGLHFKRLKFINTQSFEDKVEEAVLAYSATCGHISGLGLYPQDGPHIEMMIEQEFIL